MTPRQWDQIIHQVTELWSGGKWSTAHKVYVRVQNIPVEAFEQAIQLAFDGGAAYAPSIPELTAKARSLAGGASTFDVADCRHPFDRRAVVEYRSDGCRVSLCAVCRSDERTHAVGGVLTGAERVEATI